MRITKIFKCGHSRAAVIPDKILKTMKWREGDFLVAEIFEKDLVLSKLEFPPHIIKRLSEKRQRVYESLVEVK